MILACLSIFWLLALVWLILAVGPWHRDTFRTRLNSAPPVEIDEAKLPAVTIVVPARNEATMLPTTVPSMCHQQYPADLRVIVVDDQSEDESAQILSRLAGHNSNLTTIRAADRPAGWCGKPWAVHQGVQHASTDLLLFTDADCVFHPLAVRQAAAFLVDHNLDMLSLFPSITFGSISEQIGMSGLCSALTMLMPLSLVNNPRSKIALAAGGFILVRRGAYEKIGGHTAVANDMIEDVNLARKLKASGARCHSRFTADLVSTRMYEGFADMWEGLTKNAYAGMEYQPWKFWLGMLTAIVAVVLPPVYLAGSIVALIRAPSVWSVSFAVAAGLIFASQVLVQSRSVKYLRLPGWQCLMMPVSAGLYTLIAFHSAWQHHFRGGNLWKGRRYDRRTLVGQITGSGQVTR